MPARTPADSAAARLFRLREDEEPSIEANLEALQSLRARASAGTEDVDRLLVESLTRQAKEITELRQIQERLRALVSTLTAPPLHEAVFVEEGTVDGDRLAVVFHRGARRLVTPGPGLSLDELMPGDPVYLASEANLILGRGEPGENRVGETATVEDVLPDDRLLLRHREAEILVSRAGAFFGDPVAPGDRVVFDPRLMMAFQAAPSRARAPWIVKEVETVAPEVLGGFGPSLGRVIRRFVDGVHRPELAERYGIDRGQSLLLFGPPGCGKTTLMRVIASELGHATGARCGVAMVNGAQLESPWVGETQANIRRLFHEMDDFDGPKLLFVDEVDAIGRIRGGPAGRHGDKFLSTWLTELEGVRLRRNLAVVAATNRKDLIDPALLERLSAIELHVPRPNMAAAREIFAIHLPPTLPFSPNGSGAESSREELIDTAVELLYAPNSGNEVSVLRFRDGRQRTVTARELASGRLIEQICVNARETAFQRHVEGGERGLRTADVEEATAAAIERLRSVLTPTNARSYLSDVPQDVDVVAVDRVARRASPHRYLARPRVSGKPGAVG